MRNELSERNPFEKLAYEEGGTTLKYVKGKWTANEVDFNGKRLIADMAGLLTGWRKWEVARIVDVDIGYVRDGFIRRKRAELGDLDGAFWPIGPDGNRSDPWQEGYFLRLLGEDGEVFAWAACSWGARKAIGNLAGIFNARRAARLGGLPIVELDTISAPHTKYGRVEKPILKVIGWTEEEFEPPRLEARETAPAIAPPTMTVSSGDRSEVFDSGAPPAEKYDGPDDSVPFDD